MEELGRLSEGQEERGTQMSGRQVGPHYEACVQCELSECHAEAEETNPIFKTL